MREYTNQWGNKIKEGVEYFPGDSGGYYKVYFENGTVQGEMLIVYPVMELIENYLIGNTTLVEWQRIIMREYLDKYGHLLVYKVKNELDELNKLQNE